MVVLSGALVKNILILVLCSVAVKVGNRYVNQFISYIFNTAGDCVSCICISFKSSKFSGIISSKARKYLKCRNVDSKSLDGTKLDSKHL